VTLVAVLYFSLQKAENWIGLRIEHIAKTASAEIPGETHEQIVQAYLNQDPELMDRPFFKQIKKVLLNVKRSNQLQSDVYTFIRPEWAANTVIYTATSNDRPQVGNGLNANSAATLALEKGISAHTGFYTEKGSVWISAAAPLKTSSGKVVGALEIDFKVESEVQEYLIELIELLVSLLLFAWDKN
jgi:hypothetical protein